MKITPVPMFEPSPEKLLAMVDAAMAKFDRARECALRADREGDRSRSATGEEEVIAVLG